MFESLAALEVEKTVRLREILERKLSTEGRLVFYPQIKGRRRSSKGDGLWVLGAWVLGSDEGLRSVSDAS